MSFHIFMMSTGLTVKIVDMNELKSSAYISQA